MRWSISDALDIAEIFQGYLGLQVTTEVENGSDKCSFQIEMKPYDNKKREKYAIVICQVEEWTDQGQFFPSSTRIYIDVAWSRVMGDPIKFFDEGDKNHLLEVDLADPDSLPTIRAYVEEHFPGRCI